MKNMINKLFKLFGYELVKLQSLKDIDFGKVESISGNQGKEKTIDELEDQFYFDEEKDPVKEVVKPKVKKKQTSITIHFKDDKRLCWENISDIDDKRFQYADLYTWFFSRTTPLFMFRHSNGETIFRREDILRIERTKTIVVDKD